MVALLASLSAVAAARAEDALSGTRGEMSETKHVVWLTIDRGHARMVVRRTVRADGDRHDQAVFDLATPPSSVAVGLRTLGTANGKPIWYAGDLMEAETAAAKYKELTAFGTFRPKDPALLSWQGDSRLALQVFPVAPHAEKTIEYSLVLPTRYQDGHDLLVLRDLGLAERSPTVIVETARAEDRLWVNGQPYPSGSAMPWPGSAAGDGPFEGASTEGSSGFGSELRVVLVRASADKLAGRLAVVPLSKHGGLVHFRIEAARRFSPLPRRVSLVVLVDKSYSVDRADRDAGLVAIAQVLDRMRDARVAVLAFDRKVSPLWNGFLPAQVAQERLDDVELEPDNGSQVDDALRAATTLLSAEPKGRERRVYLLSDLLTRSALAVPSLAQTVQGADVLLHVGVMHEGEASLSPTEGTAWARLARTTGGLCWQGEARADAANLASVFEEWVRPTRLHRFALTGFTPGATNRLPADGDQDTERWNGWRTDEGADQPFPSELPEGAAYEYGGLPFEVPRRVVVRGELWAHPISLGLTSTTDEERLWSALAFGTPLQWELSPREMMTLAVRGRAVSPVTSYLAVEPGVRPSTEGLEEGTGTGGGGTGFGTIGMGGLASVGKRSFDPERFLRKALGEVRARCEVTAFKVSAQIETTRNEVVDVPSVTIEGGQDVSCLREAIWSWRLPDDFADEHATYAISLPAGDTA